MLYEGGKKKSLLHRERDKVCRTPPKHIFFPLFSLPITGLGFLLKAWSHLPDAST